MENRAKQDRYWFYFEPYVYKVNKKDKTLLYNTLDGRHIEISDKQLQDFVELVYQKENLGVVEIDKQLLDNAQYSTFFSELKKKYIGDFFEVSETKPIQLMPILNLQKDIDRLKRGEIEATGEGVLSYLSELTLFINESCQKACQNCTWYAKQASCCTCKKDSNSELDVTYIKNIVSQVEQVNPRLNITGGNILTYSQWPALLSFLSSYKNDVYIWIHYSNIAEASALPIELSKLAIPITFPVNKKELKKCMELTSLHNPTFYCYITSEEEYYSAEGLEKEYGWKNYRILPIFTGNNIEFFQKYVFTDREELFDTAVSIRKIFMHQSVNTNFFGKLTILPDGTIKANLNTPALGNINKNSMLEIIDYELNSSNAWRSTRSLEPCASCLYQYLCASPSSYEIVMSKPNLCTIS